MVHPSKNTSNAFPSLWSQELAHPVFCVDQHPGGHFVECVPDSLQNYSQRCRTDPHLPPHRLTNVTIPVVGVLYQALPDRDPATGESIPGYFVAGRNAERRRRAQAVLARHRGDGVMCNATLKKPLRADVRALVEGALSTDGASFQVGLWTVDMVQYPAVPSRPAAARPEVGRKPSREPPLWIIVLLCLGSVGGDLLGQRATRHHFKSTRR